MSEKRGALCGDCAAREKIRIETSDGIIFVEVLELRQRGGRDRFGVRIEAPLAVKIVLPHAAGGKERGG